MEEITLEQARKIIDEYGIDPADYISAHFRQFMNGDMADDNSVESYNYHQKCLRLVVNEGLKAIPNGKNRNTMEKK